MAARDSDWENAQLTLLLETLNTNNSNNYGGQYKQGRDDDDLNTLQDQLSSF